MCQPVTVFLSARLNPCQYGSSCNDATKRITPVNMHSSILRIDNVFNAYATYEHTMSRDLYTIFPLSVYNNKT